jgi:hypothetical protein
MADMYGYFMGKMVYLPATIEMLYCFLTPQRWQVNRVVQVRAPPKFVGKTYKDLLTTWMGSSECILPLGLYREREMSLPNGDSHTVMYSAGMPVFDTVIRETDYVTVIAPREWIDYMGKKRMLRCSKMIRPGASRGGGGGGGGPKDSTKSASASSSSDDSD